MINVFLSFLFLLISTEPALAKICSKGIPCGNTCIASWKTCHIGRGSAIHESELIAQNTQRTVTASKETTQASSQLTSTDTTVTQKDTYTFRSSGSGYFITESSSGKILKCTSNCYGMIILDKGSKIEFLDNFKLVEFESSMAQSCEVSKCTEIKK